MTRDKAITELVRIWHSPHLDLSLKAGLGEAIDTLKESNLNDSLVRGEVDACKESESKLDLISRAEAVALVNRAIRGIGDKDVQECLFDGLRKQMWALPSAICDDCIWHTCNYNKVDLDGEEGYISRRDVVNEIHKYFVEEIDKTPTEIDEDGDELYADMPTVNSLLACNKELSKRIKSLPSAEPQPKPISYIECANAMLKMWIDNVLTDGEYYRIMEKLNSKHMADMRGGDDSE